MQAESFILPVILSKLFNPQTMKEDEREQFESWLRSSPENDKLWRRLHEEPFQKSSEVLNAFDVKAGWEKLESVLYPLTTPVSSSRVRIISIRLMVAAVLVGIIGLVVWLSMPRATTKVQKTYASLPGLAEANLPGKAPILVLADGRQILLDTVTSGIFDSAVGRTVSKRGDTLEYVRMYNAQVSGSPVRYNIAQVPDGRRSFLMLPDGSRVWLKPGSSIRFPVSFDTTTRLLELQGEAFFDVTSIKKAGAKLPLTLQVHDMAINVTGTRFVVTAYHENTTTKTTLLKGAVSVVSGKTKRDLSPGEQAEVSRATGDMKISRVDTNWVVSGDDTDLIFVNDPIEDVLTKVAKHYNKRLVFAKDYKSIREEYTGAFSGIRTLEDVLMMIAKHHTDGKVKFKIEDSVIVVNNAK